MATLAQSSLALPSNSSCECSDEDVQETFSIANAVSVGYGGSANVFGVNDYQVVKLFPDDEQGKHDLEREKSVYKRLQKSDGSPFITKYIETWGSGLVLERHCGTLRQALRKSAKAPSRKHALPWSREICEGVRYLHQCEVLHGDIGCQNLLLDTKDHIKICDFAGSSYRNGDCWEKAWISYEVRSQHPNFRGQQPTIETEIFALGSTLFEVWTSRPPYVTEPDAIVRRKFLARDFPDCQICQPEIREIVLKCWMGQFKNLQQLCLALDLVQ